MGFPGGSDGKESSCNVGDLGSIPRLGRSPGGENGYPLQYSWLENSMNRGALWATVHGVAKSQTQLSDLAHSRCFIIHLLIQNDLLNLQFVVLGVEAHRISWEVLRASLVTESVKSLSATWKTCV